MTGRIIAITLVSFIAGAAVVIGIRSPGHAGGESRAEADDHSQHAPKGDVDHSQHDAATDHSAHAGHDMQTVYVCEQDPSYGLSYAGPCPLDGKPMVEKKVNMNDYQDLENATCPVMGGDATADVFALYQGKKVRFCCPGCGKGFFEQPEEHLKKLRQ